VLIDQADMLLRSAEESVPEPTDLLAVRVAYDAVTETVAAATTS